MISLFRQRCCDQIKIIAQEEQKYWFDHPIPLDIGTDANEIIYGLNGLNEAIAFEKAKGHAAADARIGVRAVGVGHTHRLKNYRPGLRSRSDRVSA